MKYRVTIEQEMRRSRPYSTIAMKSFGTPQCRRDTKRQM